MKVLCANTAELNNQLEFYTFFLKWSYFICNILVKKKSSHMFIDLNAHQHSLINGGKNKTKVTPIHVCFSHKIITVIQSVSPITRLHSNNRSAAIYLPETVKRKKLYKSDFIWYVQYADNISGKKAK